MFSSVRALSYYLDRLQNIEKNINTVTNTVANACCSSDNSELTSDTANYSLKIRQTEWHSRGLIYNFGNLLKRYGSFVEGVQQRVRGTNADVVVMSSRDIQYLMFEFYALVNLARISLDNLRNLLLPVFITPCNQIPKSVTEFKPGTTNCPVYEKIAKDSCISYLIDVRNCIVHYRTFATSDNAIVIREDIDTSGIENEKMSDWIKPMLKASYRKTLSGKIVVNVFLPDKIFDIDQKGKKLANFTYGKQINLIAQSWQFVNRIAAIQMEALLLLATPGKPTYIYTKIK